MRVLVLPQLPGAGEGLEALLAGVGELTDLGLDSVHQEVGTVVEVILLVRGLQRELAELLLLLGAVRGTLNYRQTLGVEL